MPTLEGIHHMGFSVTDLDRSVAWYCDVLGFEKFREVEDRGTRRIQLRHPEAGLLVGFAVHSSNPGESFSELTTGLDHIAFAASDRAELEAWLQRFDHHGVDHSPIKEGLTGWLITFRDPDNIQLEIYTRTK